MAQRHIKRNFTRLIDSRAGEWLDRQVVRLGKDDSGLIQTGKPGILWARLSNGRPIQVHVTVSNVPSRFDLHLMVGRRRSQPNIWQVIYSLEDYDDPAGGGELTYHHEQHEELGPDRLNLSRKQITARTVRVKTSASFIVRVFGDADLTVSGWKLIPTKDLNLSSYVPTSGARFVAIESDDTGALSINSGTVFGSPGIGTPANYPLPAAGKYPIARVLLFEGQDALLDEHITVSMPPSFNPLGFSSATHSHYNDAEGQPADVSTSASADGTSTYAARRDHVHLYTPGPSSGEGGGGAGHVHGIARWNGASSQTTFDLPDLAAYIESVTLNGLEEDPLVYTLSADGSQIVLDTALASATTVIAHYVLLSIEV